MSLDFGIAIGLPEVSHLSASAASVAKVMLAAAGNLRAQDSGMRGDGTYRAEKAPYCHDLRERKRVLLWLRVFRES